MSSEPKSSRFEIDMCSGPLLPKLISFTLPLMLASVLQLLFNAVDVIVVGKFAGSQALAAVGSTTSLINLIINLMIGISLGTNVIAGRFFALKDHKSMEELVHSSICLAFFGGLVLSFIGVFFSGPALRLMGTPDEVYNMAVLYIRVYFLGMPFFMLYTFGAAVLRAVGDTKRPLLYLVLAGVINAVLNVILVVGFNMAVLGVALATVVSQLISCILVLNCLRKSETSYGLKFDKLKIHKKYLPQLIKIGLPAGLQSLVINFSNVLLQSSVNSLGDIAMAGYTAAQNVFGFLYVACNSFTQTCMSFTSQNYGVKDFKRMDKVLWYCIFLSTGTMLLLGGLVYYFGEPIIHIYSDSPEVIACGAQVFLYTTSTYFICGLMDLLPGAMRGMGYSIVPMFLSVVGTVGVRIFWIYCIFPLHRSLDILFISYPLSWLVTLAMQLVYLYFVRKKVNISLLE